VRSPCLLMIIRSTIVQSVSKKEIEDKLANFGEITSSIELPFSDWEKVEDQMFHLRI
jgi:hypothetical protein